MLVYALIGLSLVLVGVVGLQFTYLFWIDRIYRERREYLRDLEHRYSILVKRLAAAERRVADQDDILDSICPEPGKADEIWAEVIEEL